MEGPNLSNSNKDIERIKQLYNEPANLVVIEFANRTNVKKFVWVEPTCVSIEIAADTEYQIITHDRTFRMEFDKNGTLIFYLQCSFGFILNKRPTSKKIDNPHPWVLDTDCSEIN